MSEKKLNVCQICGCKKSLHHGNEIQMLWDGTQFHRTCYGIGCTCEKKLNVCQICGCKKSLHHGNEIQMLWDGTQFHRTCYGIGCTCGKMFDDYPHIPITVKKIKKKKHWLIRLLKRQKIKLDIVIKRSRKKLRRRYIRIRNTQRFLYNLVTIHGRK